MPKRPPSVALIALLLSGCDKRASAPAGQPAGGGSTSAAVQQGKDLLDKGQLDQAVAKLQESPDDPIAQYYLGVAYARKASALPLLDDGFRDDDKLAVQAFEKACAAKPEFAAAHFALAEALAPYAMKHFGPLAAGKHRPKPPSPAPDDPDFSPERVAREYQAAVQNDKTSTATLDGLIKWARDMKRPDDADPAFREWVSRNKESPEAYMRYADFLADKKDRLKAIEQYQLALMWKPQDPVATNKICDIYLDWAQEHFDAGENASADARLAEARKFLVGRDSPQAARLRDLQEKLSQRRR